jgi:hypothetical protein
MKSRSRPFQVEVRRAKRHPNKHPNRPNIVLFHRPPGAVAPNSREGADPATGRAAAPRAPTSDHLVETPQVRQVLPDLRRSVIAPPKESVTAKRPAKRSQGTDGELRYAAMRALGQDQDRITGEPPGNGRAPDQNPAEDDSPGRNVPRTEAKVSPQTVPPTKGLAEAALRFSRCKKQATCLPRWDRWKERRLPHICWAKSSQSAR